MTKPKLLFIYDVPDEEMWKDGLWAAIELLKKDFEITKENLAHPQYQQAMYDFVLGWGAFGSKVDKYIQNQPSGKSFGLCLGGYAPYQGQPYDILFYEVPNWSKNWLKEQGYKGKTQHAFGVNTDIFKPIFVGDDEGQVQTESNCPKIWEYITVGAFSYWKRQEKILQKEGSKMAVGQIQDENIVESADIVGNLIIGHCGVSDSVSPERLAVMYNLSKTCYIPADLMGGGERSVWESKACGLNVIIENDNPKLRELVDSPVLDHIYYSKQLKKCILSCL